MNSDLATDGRACTSRIPELPILDFDLLGAFAEADAGFARERRREQGLIVTAADPDRRPGSAHAAGERCRTVAGGGGDAFGGAWGSAPPGMRAVLDGGAIRHGSIRNPMLSVLGAMAPGLPRDVPASALSTVVASSQGAGGGDRSDARADGQEEDAAVPVLRVLLLEDDAIDVRLIRACAAAIGSLRLSCEVVSSVAAARARMSQQTFDLCITDFWLGFESSLGFVVGMSRPGSAVPVIVLTSLSTPEIRHLCLRAGAACVIGKESLSPDVLESALAEVLRESGATAPDDRGTVPESGLDFLDRFAWVMRAAGEAASGLRDETGPERDPRALQAASRAFATLSETARLAVFEQIVTTRDDEAGVIGILPRGAAADLVDAVATGCSLLKAHGRPIAFNGAGRAMRLGCDEAALIFLAYELMNRVIEVTADRSTLCVDLRQEDGACILSVSGPSYGGMPALPVTFGTLFTSILRRCHGVVQMAHDPGRSIILAARFPGDTAAPANPRPH